MVLLLVNYSGPYKDQDISIQCEQRGKVMNNVTTKGPLIDGFAINYGNKKRTITYKDGIYEIGYFDGTYDEAAEAIFDKYNGGDRDARIAKLQDAVDMKWLTDELHERLVTHEDWYVRMAVAEYNNKYHEQLKDDEHWRVRLAVAEYSDKYHHILKDDADEDVRLVIVKYSDKYHVQFRNDISFIIRSVVAKYSDKYHEQFKDDIEWYVRLAVAEYSDKYHDQLKDDEHWRVRLAVANYKKGK